MPARAAPTQLPRGSDRCGAPESGLPNITTQIRALMGRPTDLTPDLTARCRWEARRALGHPSEPAIFACERQHMGWVDSPHSLVAPRHVSIPDIKRRLQFALARACVCDRQPGAGYVANQTCRIHEPLWPIRARPLGSRRLWEASLLWERNSSVLYKYHNYQTLSKPSQRHTRRRGYSSLAVSASAKPCCHR